MAIIEFKWTTEQPTRLGYYWALNKRHEKMTVGLAIVEVAEHVFMGQVKAMAYVLGQVCELSDFSHWLGPLPVPELPNEAVEQIDPLKEAFKSWLHLYEVTVTERWNKLAISETHTLCDEQWREFSEEYQKWLE